jgi:hypothetical protein
VNYSTYVTVGTCTTHISSCQQYCTLITSVNALSRLKYLSVESTLAVSKQQSCTVLYMYLLFYGSNHHLIIAEKTITVNSIDFDIDNGTDPNTIASHTSHASLSLLPELSIKHKSSQSRLNEKYPSKSRLCGQQWRGQYR